MLNKGELIKQLHEATQVKITLADTKTIVDAVFEMMKAELAKVEKVSIDGFGVFEVRERQARIGRNPQKPDETIEIPARKAPAFKAGKALREMVDGKKK